MKKILILIVLFITIGILHAQDKIFRANGQTFSARIVKVSPTAVDFYYTDGDTALHQVFKSNLTKIVYADGRLEAFTNIKNFPQINGPDDWEKVLLTDAIPDYTGLTEVKRVKATSMWGGSQMSEIGVNNCNNTIKKQAAKLGCSVVLITNKKMGLSTSVEGIAYKVNRELLGLNASTKNETSDNNKGAIQVNKDSNPKIETNLNSDIDVNIPGNSKPNLNSFAVIIGNENYSNEIKVPYAINDAKTFYDYATQTLGIPAKQVHLLKDATYGQFLGEFEWLENILKVYKEDAHIFIYYAGHGFPDESSKSSYILPVDGKSTSIASAIKLEDLYSKFSKYACRNITFFLDACFSGAARDGMLAEGRGVKIKPKEDILKGKIVVFSATSGDETAHPINEKQHGAFTYYLLKKIQDTKGDITYSELYQYIKENVARVSVVENRIQNPRVNTSDQIREIWGK